MRPGARLRRLGVGVATCRRVRGYSSRASSSIIDNKSTNIEVEVKFSWSKVQEEMLANLPQVEFKGEKVFVDEYYDTVPTYELTGHDIWFRKRDEKFECKVPLKEVVTATDQYRELVKEQQISAFLLDFFKIPEKSSDVNLPILMDEIRLKTFVKLTTKRRTYRVLYHSQEINIDLDSCPDIGYHIGEAEIMVQDEHQVLQAEKKVIRFCERFGWDVRAPTPGKVLYWMEKYNPEQHQILVSNGVTKRKIHNTTS